MGRAKKMKLKISETVKSRLQEVHDELESRGAENFDVSDVIGMLISSPMAEPLIDQFLNNNTPDAYKVNWLLNSPKERAEVLNLIASKSFGLKTSEAHRVGADQL